MLKKGLIRFFEDERGATVIEYALIAVFIGGALAAAMPFLKNILSELFIRVGEALANKI